MQRRAASAAGRHPLSAARRASPRPSVRGRCLVLIGGYVFFPVAGDAQQLYNNIAGVTVAMFGVVLYGHLKHASSEGKPDCLDSCCPAPISRCLDVNKYATVSPSETEGLTRHDPDDSKRNTGPD